MSDFSKQKILAAKVMNVGLKRVWIDPESSEDIESALTREDIRELISQGVIRIKPKKGVSRARARKKDIKLKYGHRKGHGSRKGAKGARRRRKEIWMSKIRAQRKLLKEFRENGTIDKSMYRKLYRRSKGGEYRSKAHLSAHIEQLIKSKET